MGQIALPTRVFPYLFDKYRIPHTFLFIVYYSTFDVIEHRHEDNSSLELFWFAHFVHELLDFVDELQRSESWENIPLEHHRFSVNCIVMNL